MLPAFRGRFVSVTIVILLFALPGCACAQSGDTAAVSPQLLEAYARAHIAVTARRSQVQAELAEPKAKKPDIQASLKEKLRSDTGRLLKEQGLSDQEFARLTRRLSTDDSLRTAFEALLARLPSGKTG